MTAIYPTPPPMLHDVPVPTKSPVANDRRLPLGTAQIIQGNALNLPLPDNSVDLICTSPPYFGLRSYQDAGVHYDGQIGSEATPTEFLDALLAATREMVRVLKPSGSIFVNLGDKYSSNSSTSNWHTMPLDHDPKKQQLTKLHTSQANNPRLQPGVPTKSLMGIPWRYAINCIDDLGFILRAEIIWSKPNGLPESVTDRVRRSHEQWFHFTRQPRYYSSVDEIREGYTQSSHERSKYPTDKAMKSRMLGSPVDDRDYATPGWEPSLLGKLPGSVWSIPTQPLTVPSELGVDHFAAYPMEWPRRIIQGWTPNGVCTMCGEGRRPIVAKEYEKRQNRIGNRRMDGLNALGDTDQGRRVGSPATPDLKLTATITGYTCACAPGGDFDCCVPLPPTTPAVVLDPFGGTGTTALVAKALGRTGITIDLSADYCRLAEWRCNDPRELAAALQVEKPEPVHPDQLDLFSEMP